MPWSQQQYEDAKALVAGGGVAKELVPKLQARITQYEDDRARGQLPAPAVRDQSAMEPTPAKPPEKASWIPSRALSVPDYIPADAGGKLVNWHDMPVETYRRTVFEPQREQLIRDGIGAQALLAKFGTISTVSPDIMTNIMTTIARGKAAEAQDPSKVTEEDPGYQAYNDQQWQEALQKHIANPDAGPIQRLAKLQGPGSSLARVSAEIMPKSIAGARGALDSMTLGLAAGPTDALMNAIEPGAGDQERSIQESRPWSSAAGNILGMANPYGASGALFRGIYGGTKGLLGAGKLARLGAGAAAGALTSAAEGGGQDLSRGDTEDLAARTGERLFLGGALGAGGEALSQAGGAIAKKLDADAVRRAGRPIFSWLESRGYKFSPLFGEISSPEAKAQLERAALDPEGRPVAQNISKRAGGPINDSVIAADKATQARQGKELEQYFLSVGASKQKVPIAETAKAIDDWLAKNETPMGGNEPIEQLYKQLFERVDGNLESGGITPREMHAWMQRLSKVAEKDSVLADAYKAAQAGMMRDIENAPQIAGGPNWSEMRGRHDFENVRVDRARQDTGVRNNAREWDLLTRDEQSPVRKAIETIGTPGARVETEQALKKFSPPDIRKELETLEAMNAARAHVNGPWTGLGSDSGTLKFMAGAARPRLYALGKGASEEVGANFPISDKLFTWLNARAPRATQFLPGMGQAQIAQLIAKQDEMSRRPKTAEDLTPEQRALLFQAMSQGARQ